MAQGKMSPLRARMIEENDMLREAGAMVDGRLKTDASGNVKLDRIASITATGVDYISSGALTHSARTVDLGLDF